MQSSLANRFVERRFGAVYDPTIENTLRVTVKLKNVHFQCDLLDTAGQVSVYMHTINRLDVFFVLIVPLG